MRILVFGDIHGRKFWKEPTNRYLKRVDKIIFLGDYFDPYKDEGEFLSYDEIMDNFNEILELKIRNPDKIVLLLGNHDFHYCNEQFCNLTKSTRYDDTHCHDFERLFNENKDLFKLCHTEKLGDNLVIFTHAGITKYWSEKYNIKVDENIEQTINGLAESNDGVAKLAAIGVERSWWFGEKAGSPLWCDIREFVKDGGLGEGYYQIFGHTRLKKGTQVTMKGFSCIDSQEGFLIDDNCKIKKVRKYEKKQANDKHGTVQDTENDKP